MKMRYLLVVLIIMSLCGTSFREIPAEKFEIDLFRKLHKKDLNIVEGELYVNGNFIGKTYERIDLRIRAGLYPGFLRYQSPAHHAQGPFGEMGEEGDFLLEIGEVTWTDGKKRTNLLFHGGFKAEHSRGCIMLGAVARDKDGNRILPDGHALRKLRKAFYGTETPNSTPNKEITISIHD